MRSAPCRMRNDGGFLGCNPRCMKLPSFRLRAQGLQLANGIATQAIEFAGREHEFACEKILEFAEPEWRSPEPPQLCLQPLGIEILCFCLNQWHRRIQLDHMALFIPGYKSQRLSRAAMNFHLERALEARFVAFEALAQTTVQFRIA